MFTKTEATLLRTLLGNHWSALKKADIKRDDDWFFTLDKKLMYYTSNQADKDGGKQILWSFGLLLALSCLVHYFIR